MICIGYEWIDSEKDHVNHVSIVLDTWILELDWITIVLRIAWEKM